MQEDEGLSSKQSGFNEDRFDDETLADSSDEEYNNLRNQFPDLLAKSYRDRIRLRRQNLAQFPYKEFQSVVGEWSRADNPYCCINACADHRHISDYLRQTPETNENKKRIYTFLANCGDAIRASREQLLSLILIDQAINKKNARGNNRDQEELFNDSSLGGIPEKVWCDQARVDVSSVLLSISAAIDNWKNTQRALEEVGNNCTDYLSGLSHEQKLLLVKTGSLDEGDSRLEIFENINEAISKAIEVFRLPNIDFEQMSQALSAIIDLLTSAQAILEGQYYAVGIASLRAVSSDKEIIPPSSDGLVNSATFIENLDLHGSIYLGESGKEYHVLKPAEVYQHYLKHNNIPPDDEVENHLMSKNAPLIEDDSAMVTVDGQLFRPRNRGIVDLSIASSVVMDALNTPHPAYAVDRIEGRSILLEQYILGAKSATPELVARLSQEDCDSMIAHMLITEDLDCQGRNFIELPDGRVFRVDSKQVFQDSDHRVAKFAIASPQQRFEAMKNRAIHDPFISEVIKKSSIDGVRSLIESLDLEDIKKEFRAFGLTEEVIGYLEQRITEHTQIALDRLSLLKEV